MACRANAGARDGCGAGRRRVSADRRRRTDRESRTDKRQTGTQSHCTGAVPKCKCDMVTQTGAGHERTPLRFPLAGLWRQIHMHVKQDSDSGRCMWDAGWDAGTHALCKYEGPSILSQTGDSSHSLIHSSIPTAEFRRVLGLPPACRCKTRPHSSVLLGPQGWRHACMYACLLWLFRLYVG